MKFCEFVNQPPVINKFGEIAHQPHMACQSTYHDCLTLLSLNTKYVTLYPILYIRYPVPCT